MGAMRRCRFPRRLRLRRRAQFARLLAEGRRLGDERLQIWALPNGLSYTRLGLMVGRRQGGAVQRNRIKRLLREAFRLTRATLPSGWDIACAPRVGVELKLAAAMESLMRLTRGLASGDRSR